MRGVGRGVGNPIAEVLRVQVGEEGEAQVGNL